MTNQTRNILIGQLVTSASPGSTLAIIGDNLRSVYEIWFNDLRASLNQSTLTDNSLFVTIPGKVPGEVTDKIYFITTRSENGRL
jgi:IPT/TIG domain.